MDHLPATPETSAPIGGDRIRVAADRARPRRVRWPRRLILAVAAVVGALVLTGCQTTVWVRVAVDRDGAGSVAVDVYLDAEAAEAVGDLSQLLVVDDLVADGWQVTGPGTPSEVAAERGIDESAEPETRPQAVQVHLERPFADVDEANRILASLSGPNGPLRDVALTRKSSAFKVTTGFAGTVDLADGLDAFGDPALTETLGGSLSEVTGASGGLVPTGDDLVVGLQLVPSSKMSWSGRTGNDATGDGTVAASATLGATPESVVVQARHTRWGAVVGAAAIVVLLFVGLVAVGMTLRRRANRAQRTLLRRGRM